MKPYIHNIYGIGMGAALAVALASCAADGDAPMPTEDGAPAVMSFGGMTSHDEATTRSDSPFQDTYRRFGVWAWKTKAAGSEEVMNHEDFTPYEVICGPDSKWHYDFQTTVGSKLYQQWMKYWDLDAAQYDFVAYAPFRIPDTDEGDCTTDIVGFDRPSRTFSISGLRGNIPLDTEGYVNWMRAHTRRDMDFAAPKDYDMMKSDTQPISDPSLKQTSTVPLVFHYLQPIIEIHAYTTSGEDITATDITMALSNADGSQARYVRTLGDYSISPDGSDAVWTYSSDPSDRASSLLDMHTPTVIKNIAPEDLADRRTKSTLLAELYELPENVSDFFAKIYVKTEGGRELYGLKTMGEGWTSVQRYIYYIIITEGDGVDEYIIMDVDVEAIPWIKGDDIEIDPPLDNW